MSKSTPGLFFMVTVTFLGQLLAQSTNPLQEDYPTLYNKPYGTTNKLDHFIEDKLEEFKNGLRKERSLPYDPIISEHSDTLPFEPEDDFYFYNNINSDSGTTEQMWINYITSGPNMSYPFNVLFLDLDVIEFEGHIFSLTTKDNGIIVLQRPLNGHATSIGSYNIGMRGLIATEVVILFNTKINNNQMVIFSLRRNGNSKALSWFTWHSRGRELIYNGTIQVSDSTSNIRLIRIPVTGGYMIATLQRNGIAIYMLDTQDGIIRLKLCNQIDALEPTSIAPFSINGQLYIAVGNGRANVSFIWKYRVQREDFEFHQSLEDANIKHLEYFRRGYEHYLAVVANRKAAIYRWEGALFLRIQLVSTDHVRGPVIWHSVHHHFSYPDDVTLLLISGNDVVQFAWNKYMGQFVSIEGTDCISWKRTRQMRGLTLPAHVHYTENGVREDACIQLGKACDGIAYRETSWYFVQRKSPLDKYIYGNIYEKLTKPAKRCWPNRIGSPINAVSFATNDRYHEFYVTVGSNMYSYKLYAANRQIPAPGQNGMPNVPAINEKLRNQEVMLERLLKTLDAIKFAEKTNRKPGRKEICPNLEARLNVLEDRIQETRQKLSLDERKTIHLPGRQEFGTLTVTGESSINGNARVKFINNLDMPYFLQDVVMKKIPTKIRGTKVFLGKSIIEGDLNVRQRLNGQRVPEDFILLNRPQNLTGTSIECMAPVRVDGNINVKHLVNGMNLSEAAVFLHHSTPQYVSGKKVFLSDVIIEEPLILNGTVNEVNITKMANETVTKSSFNRSITGLKTFDKVSVNSSLFSKTVNGLDLKRLDETTVKVNEPVVVTAPKTFAQPVHFIGKAQLKANSWNGLRVPNDLVHASDRNVVLDGRKEVVGKVTIIGNLTVGGKLDGIDLKDVFYTNGDQKLCGTKKFADAEFSRLQYKEKDSDIDANVTIIRGNLRIVSELNGQKLRELHNDLIFKNATRAAFTAPIVFEKPQLLSGSEVKISGLLNGFNTTEDFVYSSGTPSIAGNKIFLGPSIFNGDLNIEGTLNSLNLEDFSDQVVRLGGQPQIITGKKTFKDGVTIARLHDSSNSNEGEISLPITAKILTVKGNLDVVGTVNDVDFKNVAAKRLTLSTKQEIRGSLSITDAIGMENLHVFGKLNKVNVTSLWNDVLWKNSKQRQIITGIKEFRGQVATPNLITRQGLNGLAMADVHGAAIYLRNGSSTKESITFVDGIEIGGPLVLKGRINGIDFNKLVEDSVLRSRPQRITGVKIFDNLRVKGSLLVSDSINDMKLDRDVLTINTPQTITGHYSFGQDVRITDNVNVKCDLSANQVAYTQGDVETVTLRGDVITDALWTGGNLNGIDFIHLWTDAVHTTDQWITINGTKRLLGKVTFAKNLNVLGTIDAFDYPLLFKSIVTTDGQNQVVTAPKEFTKTVEIPHLTCLGNIAIYGKFNGIGVNKVPELIHPISWTIPGNVTIENSLDVQGNVTLASTLNGVRIPDEVMINPGESLVSGRKIAKDITVMGNIIANSVNSYNLPQLEADTLMVDGGQRVTGRKVFKGGVAFVQDTGIDKSGTLSKDLSTSDNLPSFPMNLRFHGNVIFKQGVSINNQIYNTSVENEEQKPRPVCSKSECQLLDSVWENFVLRADVVGSMQKIQGEQGPFTNAKMQIIRHENGIYLAIGFDDCTTPLHFQSWAPMMEQFITQGTSDIYSASKMVDFKYKTSGYLLVYHYDCQTEAKLASLIALETNIKPRRILKQILTRPPLDVDILVNEENILIAEIHLNESLLIHEITIDVDVVQWRKLINFTIPKGMTTLKWLPDGTDQSEGRIILGGGNSESNIYVVQAKKRPNGDVKLVPVLDIKTSKITCFEEASYRHDKALAIAQLGGIKIHAIDSHLREVDNLRIERNTSAISLESLEVSDKLYLVANFQNQLDIYIKEGASSFVKKLAMSADGVTFAKMFDFNHKLYLLTFSNKEWSVFRLLMQGVGIPPLKVDCTAPLH